MLFRSGGGHWCGGMAILYPERVIAAWLRSGVPLVEPTSSKGNIQNYSINAGVLAVPIMLNLGTKEGVSVKDDRFSGVWPANQEFFNALRSQGGLIGISIDPLTSHECGNQRYLAVPWLDECLSKRLPDQTGQALRAIKSEEAWLTSADGSGTKIEPNINHASDATSWAWLPSERIAKLWVQYSKDSLVLDETPPPEPTQVLLDGEQLNWECQADVESGLAYFVVEKDGKEIARVPEKGNNPFGRPVFQGLQYSDTPPMPLVVMSYRIAPTDSSGQQTDSKTKEAVDPKGNDGKDAGRYTVHAVNTAGQVSKKTRAVVR